jgi:allophanate hydrolase subunit 2
VLGPDHATLGGYPVLAVVAAADHGSLGQCAPGTRVRFVPVDLKAAERAWRALRRRLDGAVVGHYPLAAG